jgi:transcriptional regulator with XRE-family HTH domain
MVVLENIKKIRKINGINQKKMAELLNISQPGYQKIEQGVNVLSIERFLDICRILKVDSYNVLLPAVNADNVDKIEKVLIAGSLAFDNIRHNSNYCQKLLDSLIQKVENENIPKEDLIEELKLFDNYLQIIRKDSFTHENQFRYILELIEKID